MAVRGNCVLLPDNRFVPYWRFTVIIAVVWTVIFCPVELAFGWWSCKKIVGL